MSYVHLETERDGAILRVWLNRPDRLNALHNEILAEVEDLYRSLQSDFDLRVVVLGGRGRAFSSGADRKPPEAPARDTAPSARELRHLGQVGRRACQAIAELEVATLARVQGYAVGGGFALALACDFRIAAESAIFHVPEVDLGVPLGWGATPRLIQEVGAARAREIIVLCDRVDAALAERWGVVHRCVPDAELDKTVDEWAARLAQKPELAMNMVKTQFRAYAQASVLGDVSEADGDLLGAALRSDDARSRFRFES